MNFSCRGGRRACPKTATWSMALLLGAVAVAALLLVACGPQEDRTAQQTADAALVFAQQTIDAALNPASGAAAPRSTPTPPPEATPDATATQRALDVIAAEQARVAAQATQTAEAAATATQRAVNQIIAQIVAATAAEQARVIAQERATTAALATHSAQTAEAAVATLTAQAATPTPDLLGQLRSRLAQARVVNRYPERADRLLMALVSRLDEFAAPGYGVSQENVTAALLAPRAEDRLNALVDNVWFEWEKDAGEQGWDAYGVDPNLSKISPLRKLIIRLIQGTQGAISEQQAYAFYNFLTRNEEDHVWFDYVQGVIGAVNREVFNWP